jgi:hypothetical protein
MVGGINTQRWPDGKRQFLDCKEVDLRCIQIALDAMKYRGDYPDVCSCASCHQMVTWVEGSPALEELGAGGASLTGFHPFTPTNSLSTPKTKKTTKHNHQPYHNLPSPQTHSHLKSGPLIPRLHHSSFLFPVPKFGPVLRTNKPQYLLA